MAGEMPQGTSKLQTIQHFSHKHPLTQVNGIGAYTCDGCKLYGVDKTYRCSDCDYDLHEYCATCPYNLRNSCHGPDHELCLYSGPGHMTERLCYVCRVYIQGMFYICKQCSFESHPLCTLAPMHTSSPEAMVTTQRSLHEHAGQPSSPHHHGQANAYGYPHTGWSVPYPYGGSHHHHQHHHDQHLVMNSGSPKGAKPGPSTPKKKKKGILNGFQAVLGVTATIATNVVVASLTGSNEEVIPM